MKMGTCADCGRPMHTRLRVGIPLDAPRLRKARRVRAEPYEVKASA